MPRDEHVPHEDAHDENIAEELEEALGEEGSAITAAVTAHALNATFSDTEVEAALNALGTKINEVITALEARNIVEEN
jgi:hypothetical protein